MLGSVADGKVFDTIWVVEERYAKVAADRTFTSKTEIFRTTRVISSIPAGQVLRVGDHAKFRLVSTMDNWANTESLDSTAIGPNFFQADIPTAAEQVGTTISFSMEYPEENRWVGRNYDVAIVASSAVPAPAAVVAASLDEDPAGKKTAAKRATKTKS